MKLSRETGYGLQGLIFLAKQRRERPVGLDDIAKTQRLPRSFLAKTFQKFARHGLVRSFRGVDGGFMLARPPAAMTLGEIVEAVEGPDLFDRCVFWSDRCADENPCPLHPRWALLKDRFVKLFEETTLEELAKRPRVRRMPRRP
ncbi:MAG: Rrf2 family transcriptional regulator [candidate division NC10 bacterium]|nr:Rrf2 family transcriptional regulator [candidate division NC10 bacterium]MBI4412833.1 Rrf2 family transcriptional regulator [candidate division NC10 bacterium]